MTSTLTHPADPAARSHDDDPLRLLVLVGSVREGRFGPVPARWIAGVADTRPDIEVQLVDLAEITLPVVLPESDKNLPESVTRLGTQISAADAVVVVTPVYNRGYPASLRTPSTGSTTNGRRPRSASSPTAGGPGASRRSSSSAPSS